MASNAVTGRDGGSSRRSFLKGMAAAVGGVALAGGADRLLGATLSGGTPATLPGTLPAAIHLPASASAAGIDWADHMGLELYTVRDMIARDYIGTLEKVAQIGFKEIEPAEEYANLSPKRFRAELDRLGLTMPSTHSGIIEGPDMEQRLAGFQIMGIQYTSLDDAPPAGAGNGPRPARPPAPVSRAEQRRQLEEYIRRSAQPRTVEDVKQEAARYNRVGKVARKYGMKLLRHNHTVEFVRCADADQVPYTILLAETDPELVAFQMDIGWACVAGQDPIQLFQQHPGRFPLWHVKDAAGLKCLPPASDEGARMAEARLVPVGTGDIDYGEIFKHADVAGLKHFAVEQDSAADWGDSIAATRVSYQNLRATLTQRVS